MNRSACVCLVVIAAAACDHGLVPPDEPASGVVRVDVTYAGHPESWPGDDELHELLFVAMRFVPRDTSDFLQLNRMVLSDPLSRRVPEQTVILENVQTGLFPYAGVAQKYGPGTFDWRPVGLVQEDGGVFVVVEDETSFVSVVVDFDNPPPFPPPVE